jgi:glutamate 5-kinase
VDDGAQKVLVEKPSSLLLPGIRKTDGEFSKGAVVSICDRKGKEFARGVTRHDASSIRGGKLQDTVVVHRDHLVVL